MGDIQFPDVWGTIAKVSAIENADAQRNYLAEDRKAKLSAAPFIQGALSGDRNALNEVATRHPDTAMKLAPLLERMDAGQRTKAKEAAEFTANASNAVLQADPADRPTIYQQVLADGKARGFDLSRLPPQYSPQIDAQLRTYRSMAIPVLEHFKQSGEGVQFAPPAGGGATPAGAIGGIESGGKYDAVGPVANAQGHRAYGKYQVLEPNIGPWTQEILGKAMTPQEFLTNPQAQDAVFQAKFGQYTKQYGPEGAARAWFAGPGGMNNPNAKDVLGTTVAGYGQKFAQATNPAGGPTGGFAPPDVARSTSIPQGDNTTGGDGSGNPVQPPAALAPLRGLQLPPGARVALHKGVPIVKDGAVLYIDAQGGWGAAPLPARKDPAESGGPFAGNSMDAQARNIVLQGDPSTAPYAAAYAHLAEAKIAYDPVTNQLRMTNPDMSWASAPTFRGGGQPVAPGVTVQATPPGSPPNTTQLPSGQSITSIEGGGAQRPMTEDQAKAATFYERMAQSNANLEKTAEAGLSPVGKALEFVPMAGNYLQSQDYQLYEQARRDFINAQLRRESGAVISKEEFDNAEKQYFPRAGDKPETLKQKAENRRIAIEGMRRSAGQNYKPASPEASQAPKPGGTYIGPDNRQIPWAEIETTAKNRGISTDEVINKLGLKPTGGQ